MEAIFEGYIIKTAEWIYQYANCCCPNIEVLGNCHAYLSMDYLYLPPGVLFKLAAKFVGPNPMVEAIGYIAFHL